MTSSEATGPPERRKRIGTILVVDDDPALLKLVKRILDQQGHQVLVANTLDETRKLADAHPAAIDLLLSDVIMPKVSAPEIVAAVRASSPHVKIMYMSGHTAATIISRGVSTDGVFIQKPFTPGELARRIEEILSTSNGTTPSSR